MMLPADIFKQLRLKKMAAKVGINCKSTPFLSRTEIEIEPDGNLFEPDGNLFEPDGNF